MNDENENRGNGIEPIMVAQLWALALHLPLRRRIGRRVLGLAVGIAWLGTLFYGGLLGAWPVLAWAVFLLLAIVCHRVAVLIRWGGESEPHTYYCGYPWLGELFFRRLQEGPVRGLMEPALMVGLAVLLAPFGAPTFIFFAGGAVCMAVTTIMFEMRHLDRRDDMRDTIIEGRMVRPNSKERRW